MFGLQFTLAARYLWGRKLRSFLTTLAIVFGTLAIFSTNLILPTMIQAFQSNLMAASGQVDVTITHKTGEAFARSALSRVQIIPGVRASAGSLSRVINIPAGYYEDEAITALTLNGIDPRAAQTLRSYPVEAGRFLRSSDRQAAVISASLAESLGLSLDDELSLPTTAGNLKFQVVGLLPARALPGNEEVLLTLSETQNLFDLPKRINTIELNLNTTDPAQRQVILDAIQAAPGDEYSLGALSSGAELLASVRIGQAAFNMFGFLALVMGGFIILNTFRTIIAERRRDIGMLRAVGASRGTIIGMILVEGILQGVVGSVAGIFLGYLLGAGGMLFLRDMFSDFLHMEIGSPVVQPGTVVITLLIGVGVTLLAGLIPAFSAGRVTPLEALRPAVAEEAQRTRRFGTILGAVLIGLSLLGLASRDISLTWLGGLLLLVGLVLAAPALVRPIAAVFSRLIEMAFAREGTGALAQSNLTRQPSRAAITASATMIGLAIIVGLGGMIWSLTDGFLGILQRSLGSDYLIMPPAVAVWRNNVGAQSRFSDELRAIPGVGVVASMRYAAATANGDPVSLLGIDPVAYPQVASLTFQAGDPQTAFAALANERSLILNGVFAAQTGLKIGDAVRLSTPTGGKIYRVAGVAGDYLNAKISTAYISQANLRADFRKAEDIFYQINLAPGADPAQVEPRLAEALRDYPQFSLVSGRKYYEQNREIFNAVFVFYFVLLAVLATPSLIALLNTLAIGVIERTREIGMLRAIGATRRQVRRLVVAESLLLAAIGTAFGLLAGLYLGYVMVLGLSSGGFPVEYRFPYQGLLAGAATGLIFAVIAALLPARQAVQMDIIQALRYE